MISYAQNFEDVILSRAFRGKATGFYIDVGAGDPTIDSVTCWFYSIGWRGINIEPSREYFELLKRDRPGDINLDCAIGASGGTGDFYEVEGSGLSSLDEDCVDRAQLHGFPVRRSEVEIRTLADVCREAADQPIDFLKIDVEGLELQVIEGADWTAYRPRIVVVEATRPLTREPSYGDWEPVLLRNGYSFAWFDGLNRFYVAREHSELAATIAMPPNLFDEFIRYAELPSINFAMQEWRQRALAAEAALRALRDSGTPAEPDASAAEPEKQT